MDNANTLEGQPVPLVAASSEPNIASQLLEDQDEEMSPPTEDKQEGGDEDEVSDLLKEQDSDMVDASVPILANNSERDLVAETDDAPTTGMDVNSPSEAPSMELPVYPNDTPLEESSRVTEVESHVADAKSATPAQENEPSFPELTNESMATTSDPQPSNSIDAAFLHTSLAPNYPPIPYPPIEVSEVTEETEVMEIDDDEDDEEDEEDAASELSDGEDLRYPYRMTWKQPSTIKTFLFTAVITMPTSLTTAPNPCLHISGLGLVGLPLSERDAKALISCATLAPFGHGERTVVDKDVRDTREIEPDRIAFANPQWTQYVNGTICAEVCRSLGVTMGRSPPRMDLYKLLLYEKGSHFLPHQDTQKAEGMFATVIILLPSAYAGGQVVVSHASSTKTIDFAPNSLLSTALLAWYTDVRHEVKPVTAGYRLALSYNMMQVAPPGAPVPTLPHMDGSIWRLRRILRKWREDRYQEVPDPQLIAYVLNHEYSAANLSDGVRGLKGSDLHRVTFIRDVAAELGYTVALASLTHNVSGSADDDGGYYHRRGRYDYDSESSREDTPGMGEVEETSTKIKGLVDLDGHSVLSFGEVELGDENLIPREPFEGETPDKTQYEGYMGNGAGGLEHWYHRTALVLMHEDDEDDICFSVGGLSYALGKLARVSDPPTDYDRLWAKRVTGKYSQLNKAQAMMMLNLALKWNDAGMWKDIMKNPVCTLDSIDRDFLFKSWATFSFDTVKLSFEDLLARSNQLSAKINFIYSIRPTAKPEEKVNVFAWCKKESDKVLSSYHGTDPKDVPTVMSIIRIVGLKAFVTTMLPNLLKQKNSYAFWIALIKALRDNKQAILDRMAKKSDANVAPAPANDVAQATPTGDNESTGAQATAPATAPQESNTTSETTPNEAKDIVEALIAKGLQAAAGQWSDAPNASTTIYATAAGRYGYQTSKQNFDVPQTAKLDRVIEVLTLALNANNFDVCRILFVDLLKYAGNPTEKFTRIYTPLIPRLRTLLSSKNIDICSPLFIDLFQVFIGTYLRDVLGKKGQITNTRLRKIGCGCADCQPLDRFMLNPQLNSETFRLVQARRLHLERQIANASDLCTFQTIKYGSPHGVQVTKRPEVMRACLWESRQKDAQAFLATVGSEDVLKRIMGARYPEVVAAINGTLAFASVRAVGDVPPSAMPVVPTASTTTPLEHTRIANGATAAPAPAVQPSASSSVPKPAAVGIVGSIAGPSTQTRPVAQVPLATNSVPEPTRVAGKKRKTNPIVNLGVIDLTEDD